MIGNAADKRSTEDTNVMIPRETKVGELLQNPVARDDEVGLDGIHPHLDRQLIRAARVFGSVAGRTAVADDEGPGHALRLAVHSGFTAVTRHRSAPVR